MQLTKQWFFIVVLFALVGCTKSEKKCGYDVVFEVPEEVHEGEDVTLTIGNLADKPSNTNYTLKPADKSGLSLYNGEVNFYQKSEKDIFSYDISDFNLYDQGNYSLYVSTGYDHCEAYTIVKSIKMIPETAPCSQNPLLKVNDLYVSDALGEEGSQVSYSPQIYNLSESSFTVELREEYFDEYSCEIEFFRGVPEISSSYTALSGHYNSAVSFDFDSNLFCNIKLYANGYPTSYFKLKEFDHKVYVVRNGNQLKISFCDVKFKGEAGQEKFVTTIVEINL